MALHAGAKLQALLFDAACSLSRHVRPAQNTHLSLAPASVAVTAPAVTGVLKGYDQLLNLVLDDAVEYLRGAQQQERRGGGRGALQRAVSTFQLCTMPGAPGMAFSNTTAQVDQQPTVSPKYASSAGTAYCRRGWLLQAGMARVWRLDDQLATSIVWLLLSCAVPSADPNDSMRVTDDTRTLGVVVSASVWRV